MPRVLRRARAGRRRSASRPADHIEGAATPRARADLLTKRSELGLEWRRTGICTGQPVHWQAGLAGPAGPAGTVDSTKAADSRPACRESRSIGSHRCSRGDPPSRSTCGTAGEDPGGQPTPQPAAAGGRGAPLTAYTAAHAGRPA
eukprot:352443-Chlamydomonas_euryale.AAC.6